VKRVVLDASALMTFFLGRPGAEKVKDIILAAAEGRSEVLLSVVNWGEVYYSIHTTEGPQTAEKKLAEIAQLPIQVVSADMEVTRLAAELKAGYRLPYADCFAAALAIRTRGSVATSDRDFRRIERGVKLIWVHAG
jgi:predicted nucleic acid-binding protein